MSNVKLCSVKQYFSNVYTIFKILGKEQKLGILLRIIFILFNIAIPLVLIQWQRYLIEMIEADIPQKILLSVIAISLVLIVQKLFEIVFGLFNNILNNSLSIKLECNKYRKSAHLQLYAFDDPEMYEKMQKAGRIGTEIITDFISRFFELISSVSTALTFFIILFNFSKIILITTIIGAVPVILYSKLGNSYEDFDKKRTPIVRRMDYFKSISMDGNYTKELKLFGNMPFVLDRHKYYHDQWSRTEEEYRDKYDIRSLFISAIIFIFHYIIPACILILSVSKRQLDIAGFTYYLSAIGICGGGLKKIIGFYYDNCISVSRIDDYFDFINLPLDERKGESVPKEWFDMLPDIEFRNVCFHYNDKENDTLHNINFIIRSGERIALVGLNGAGKTTLIKLLCGLYVPTEGEILIGGRNIIEFSQESLYTLFSVVFQDYITYDMTLRESLLLGNEKHYSDNELWEALEKVGGGNLRYDTFNDDLNTFIGKNTDSLGIDLSGGEKQKIALARCILQNRAVTVLDEPTSALDAFAEEEIMHQFLEIEREKTTILVSHRLSAAKLCDKIIILKDGMIAECGSHNELILNNNIYAEMWKIQSSQYIGDVKEYD